MPNTHPTEFLTLSPEETRARISDHLREVVLLDSDPSGEYGFWLTPFDSVSIEHWWRNKVTFNFVWNPDGGLDRMYRDIFGVEPEKHLPFDIPGTFLDDETSGTTIWLADIWEELRATKQNYKAVFCCDHDAYLERPDGTHIFHKGSRFKETL